MKNRYLAGFLGLFIISAVATFGQEPIPVKQQIPDKPLIFSQLPERSFCNADELVQLFRIPVSSSIIIHLNGNLPLRGVITENIQRSPGTTSINIRLSDYAGALFNISLIEKPGYLPMLNGRIVHPQSGDVLVLTQENNQYILQRKAQKFFMTE